MIRGSCIYSISTSILEKLRNFLWKISNKKTMSRTGVADTFLTTATHEDAIGAG